MIFEQEYVVFEILDVVRFEQIKNGHGDVKNVVSGRNFDAISFRYEADTLMECMGKTTHLHDNSICYLPSNVSYMRNAKKDKLIAVHFKCFNYRSLKPEIFLPHEPDKYRVMFEEMLACWEKKEHAYKNECSSILYKIFSEFCRDNATSRSSGKISEAVAYINQNYAKKDISLKLAAEKSFVSEPYFRRLFKNEFKTSPKKYIINLRINHAKALLLTGFYQVYEVSELCGYNDSKHFSVEFKKVTGVSPSEYVYNFYSN